MKYLIQFLILFLTLPTLGAEALVRSAWTTTGDAAIARAGMGLTNLNASNILTGTIDAARLPTTNTSWKFEAGSPNTLVVKDGKVGVNSDAPLYDLDVNGGIRARGSLYSSGIVRATSYFEHLARNRWYSWDNGIMGFTKQDGTTLLFSNTNGLTYSPSGFLSGGATTIRSNSWTTPPTLSPGDIAFLSQDGVPMVRWQDASGVESTNRLGDYSRVFNVKHYGAAGDGSTVDTAAIQAAVDDCGTNGGGMVYLPPGTYILSTNIIHASLTSEGHQNLINFRSNNIVFAGAGMGATTIRIKPSAELGGVTAVHNIFGAGETVGATRPGCTNLTLMDFTLDGSVGAVNYVGDGTQFYNCGEMRFIRVEFLNIPADAVDAGPYGRGNVIVQQCVMRNCQSAVHTGGNPFTLVSDTIIENCGGWVGDSPATALEMTGTEHVLMENLYITGTTTNLAELRDGCHIFRNCTVILTNGLGQATNTIQLYRGDLIIDNCRFSLSTAATFPLINAPANTSVSIFKSHFLNGKILIATNATVRMDNNRFDTCNNQAVLTSGGKVTITGNEFNLASEIKTYSDNAIISLNRFLSPPTIGAGTNVLFSHNYLGDVPVYFSTSKSHVLGNFGGGIIALTSVTNRVEANSTKAFRFNGGGVLGNYIANNSIEAWSFIGGATSGQTNYNVLFNNRNPNTAWTVIDGL